MIVEQNADSNSLAALGAGRLITVNVSKKRLEKFLLRWVNIGLPDDHAIRQSPRVAVPSADFIGGADKLRHAFPDMFLSESIFKSEQFVPPLLEGEERAGQEEMLKALNLFAEMMAEQRIAKGAHPRDWDHFLAPTRRQFANATNPLPTAAQIDTSYVATIARFGRRLQILWDSPDDNTKHKRFVQLHYWLLKFFLHPRGNWAPEDLMEDRYPFSDPLDQLITYLGENLTRLKHCPTPDCKTPYFLASKGNSKYCSPGCADYGRRQDKLRYWKTKGSAKRAAANAASKRKPAKKAKR